MATDNALYLRFRNIVEGADGIEAHRELLSKYGCVWWGWWRRGDEPNREDDLRQLTLPTQVVAISTADEVGFQSAIDDIKIGAAPPPELIPAYYRDRAASIPVWFRLSAPMQSLSHNDLGRHLALLSGENKTLFIGAELSELERTQKHFSSLRARSPWLVHLSDIHLGTDHAFRLPGGKESDSPRSDGRRPVWTLAEAVAVDLASAGAQTGAVLITGDLVTRNDWTHRDRVVRFIEDLSSRLEISKDHIIVLPGNHDLFRGDEEPRDFNATSYSHEDGFRIFLNLAWRARADAPLERVVKIAVDGLPYVVALGCLNSARWSTVPGFHEFGYVGRDKLNSVLERFDAIKDRAIRVLALHHHVVPVAAHEWVPESGEPKKPISVTLDAGNLLDAALGAGVSAVLHGHQHSPLITKIDRKRILRTSEEDGDALERELYVLSGGTAGSTECHPSVGNCYGLLRLKADELEYEVRGLDPLEAASRRLSRVRVPVRCVAGPA